MNAPQERGEENFMKVQFLLLIDEIMNGSADERTFAILRIAAKNLPEDARPLWNRVEGIHARLDNANTDPSTLTAEEKVDIQKLRTAIDAFANRFSVFLHEFMNDIDPETGTALEDALVARDVTRVNRIYDSIAALSAHHETATAD